MKKIFLSISAYFLSLLIGLSFFTFLFKIFQFNYFIGLIIVGLMVFVSAMLIFDKDFIQEAEEVRL